MTPTDEVEHLAVQQEFIRLQQSAAKRGHALRNVRSGYVLHSAKGTIYHRGDLADIAKALTSLKSASKPVAHPAQPISATA